MNLEYEVYDLKFSTSYCLGDRDMKVI